MTFKNEHKRVVHLLLVVTIVMSLISLGDNFKTQAQNSAAFVREVRAMEASETGRTRPAGLAFSPKANVFFVVEALSQSSPAPAQTEVFKLTQLENPAGSARLQAALSDPINTAYDSRFGRLLFYKTPANRIIEVREAPDGNLDPKSMTSYSARHFGLQNPQGLSVDPASGTLYLLDAAGPRLVQVVPEANGGFDGALVSAVDLQAAGLVDVRGVAFEPASGHLHILSPGARKLFEITPAGQVVNVRDMADFTIHNPQAIVFAPSGDQTDDPSQSSLYLADSGASTGQAAGSVETLAAGADAAGSSGKIVEFTFAEPLAVLAADFTSALIATRNLGAVSPPIPDSAGIAFIPGQNRLVVSDSEVEETAGGISHFQGANVWLLTLSGGVVDTANISTRSPAPLPITNEPTGTAYNPNNGHYLFSSDATDEVYDVNPGPDGQLATGDDSWTSFDTQGVGSGDSEGLAFDAQNNRVFVVDGVNLEVYEFTSSGSPVGHFDVGIFGFIDPESVEYNPDSGTLFVMDSRRTSRVIIETTRSGSLIQTIDISANGSQKAAGLAYAPASNGSGEKRFYIVDRGIDNDSEPQLVDGKLYEMTAPTGGTNPPTDTPTPTPTATPSGPPSSNLIYLSPAGNGTVGNLAGVRDEDIAYYNGTSWSMFFDGSDVGVGGADVDAFYIVDSNTILMSFMAAVTLGSLGPVDAWDIVQFDATSTGDNTAGAFSWYLDGSDVGLDVSADNIDAIDVLPDGRVLVSTAGNVTVPGVSGGRDEDLVAFEPSSLGSNTSGTWTMYFDGSDVALGETSGEDIDGVMVDDSGKIYLSTRNTFSVNGVAGDSTDVFVCTPGSLGNNTSCSYSSALYLDGSTHGLSGNNVDAIDLP